MARQHEAMELERGNWRLKDMLKPRSQRALTLLLGLIMAISGWLGVLLAYHPHEDLGAHAPYVVVTAPDEVGGDGAATGKLAQALGDLCETLSACHAPAVWQSVADVTLAALAPHAAPPRGDSRMPASADLSQLTRPPNTRVG
jgi:hypothetical protein